MSDLFFVDDAMERAFEAIRQLASAEARIDQIQANASRYADQCSAIRKAQFPLRNGHTADFHRANEGLGAVRIIMGAV
jgi:hypothetical protein